MRISILIPHYKSKITAYCIYKLLEHKGRHDIEILVIDNSYPHESIECLNPFLDKIKILSRNENLISSHGIAYDAAMRYINTDYIIFSESDCFPIKEGWLNYYQDLVEKGYDYAGSLLKLSGGEFIHPAGAMLKKSVWEECKKYCDEIPYKYFPNMSRKNNFDCHLMIRNDWVDKVLDNPDDFIELAENYKPYTKEAALLKAYNYSSCTNVFHNGMGNLQESFYTYGDRNIKQDSILIDNKKPIVNRIGYEPSQFFCYWAYATNKKVFEIPTEVKWMQNRENEQQEYTKTENGVTHIWAGSSYLDMKDTPMNDVYEFKKNQIDELYNSLPEQFKINT